ncbi:hypothetical protein DMENIID0001_043800 [Sergentomyia squamirostris]
MVVFGSEWEESDSAEVFAVKGLFIDWHSSNGCNILPSFSEHTHPSLLPSHTPRDVGGNPLLDGNWAPKRLNWCEGQKSSQNCTTSLYTHSSPQQHAPSSHSRSSTRENPPH